MSKKFFCKGKKGYCDRYDGVTAIRCDDCDFMDGTGGEYVEAPKNQYDRIKQMSIDELSEFICSIYDTVIEGKDVRCIEGYQITDYDEDKIKEWLESEVESESYEQE